MPQWVWIVLTALVIVLICEELRILKIRRDRLKQEELFKVVTENAADMIALVDTKGLLLYNSPSYKRILVYSPAELGETSDFVHVHPDDRMLVLDAAREAR
jgi:PAS domain S-box-containing protein